MKSFVVLLVLAFALACSANAASVILSCSSAAPPAGASPTGFAYNTAGVSFEGTGSIVCPAAGVNFAAIVGLSSLSAQILLQTDYTGGSPSQPTNSVETSYAPSLSAGTAASDNLGSAGAFGGSTPPATQTGSLAFWFNPFSLTTSNTIFADPITGLTLSQAITAFASTQTVNYTTDANGHTNAASSVTTQGNVQGVSGQVSIEYDYTITSAAPEPVSMVLFGSGLLGLSLIGRKRSARK